MNESLTFAKGISAEWVLVIVATVQVFIILAQVWVARGLSRVQGQQVAVAALPQRVELYEAAKGWAHCCVHLNEQEEICGWEAARDAFSKHRSQYEDLYPAYAHLFDRRTKAAFDEIRSDCYTLRQQLGDVDDYEEDGVTSLSNEERKQLEKQLVEEKLKRLAELVGRHLRVF